VPISPVYTTRFIGQQGVSSSSTYIVPVGFVAVVTSADLYVNTTPVLVSTIRLKSFTGGWTWAVYQSSETGLASHHWEGRVAFPESEEFGFESDGTDWDVTATGYLLTLSP